MRDPYRITDTLRVVEHYWRIMPDMRLMQLLMNLDKGFSSQQYYWEDDSLVESLKAFYSGKLGLPEPE